MKDNFTNRAKGFWNSISDKDKQLLVNSVWCSKCAKMTTITEFNGHVEKGDLILTGYCLRCSHKVARLIEGE